MNMNNTILKHQQVSWISRLLNMFSILFNMNIFLSSMFLFGIIPWIPWFAIMFFTSYHHTVFDIFLGSISYSITLPAFLTFIWIFFGPYLIYKYENQVLPLFFFYSKQLCSSKCYNKLLKVSSQYTKYSRRLGLIIFPLTIIISTV